MRTTSTPLTRTAITTTTRIHTPIRTSTNTRWALTQSDGTTPPALAPAVERIEPQGGT